MKNVKDSAIREEFLTSKKNDLVILSFYGDNNLIDFKEYLKQVEYCSKALKVKDMYVCNIDDEECDFNTKEKFYVKKIPYSLLFYKNSNIEFRGTFSNELFIEKTKNFLSGRMAINFLDTTFIENFIQGRIEVI
jgi:hypothetical protein